MSEGSSRPPRAAGAAGAADANGADQAARACAQARHLLAKFVAANLSAREDKVFRGHLVRCGECRRAYRETIATAARWKHATTEAQLAPPSAESRRIERQARRRRSIAKASRGAGAGWRLKMVLVPAGMILLLSGLGPFWRRTAHLVARWEAGSVEAAGLRLGDGLDEVQLTAGDWCVTQGGARVWVEGYGGRFVPGPDTRVVIEEPRTPQLRLLSGKLELEGSGVVSTQLGLVTLEEGEVRLEARRTRLEVDCLQGRATVLNAGLERELTPGQHASVGLGEILVWSDAGESQNGR